MAQIDKSNVHTLTATWTFRPTDSPDGHRQGSNECNPIIADSVLYVTSARHRLYAVHVATGKMLWSFDPFFGGRGGGANRGVTWWHSGTDSRILLTAGSVLFELDARSGSLIDSFGDHGAVSLEMAGIENPEGYARPTSPGIIYNHYIILGCEVSESHGAAPGYIRAFDVLTGKLVWTFHTIPKPGEPGYDTWPPDAWKVAGGANNWGGMSLDVKRGIVYAPTGSPAYDFDGADRKGMNLYGNSIIALDAKTGSLKWYYQVVHHDLWDYDLPAPPCLLTVQHEGKAVDVLAQVTKHGFLFVLDRETGKPLFPIEERKVPHSNVPGEEAWPTQPFPTKPAPYTRQSMDIDELNDRSAETKDSLMKAFLALRYEGLFTPPDVRGTLMIPGTRGGSEWGGAGADPFKGVVYINASESPEILTLKKIALDALVKDQTFYMAGQKFYNTFCVSCHGSDRQGIPPTIPSLIHIADHMSRADVLKKIREGGGKMPGFGVVTDGHERAIIDYLFELEKDEKIDRDRIPSDTTSTYMNTTAYGYFNTADDDPAVKQPWGTLNAIDLNTGEYLWKVTLGNFPDKQKPGGPITGAENYGGLIVTGGGLIFVGATTDKKFRAFDKDTGEMLWETSPDGAVHSSPSTYEWKGKQYVVISVSGSEQEPAGEIVAYALPEESQK